MNTHSTTTESYIGDTIFKSQPKDWLLYYFHMRPSMS